MHAGTSAPALAIVAGLPFSRNRSARGAVPDTTMIKSSGDAAKRSSLGETPKPGVSGGLDEHSQDI